MGKSVVREYDNSAVTASFSAGFAVVVPGYVNNEIYNPEVFDENGIYECGSQADFLKNVGKHNGVRVEAKGPKFVEFDDYLTEYNISEDDHKADLSSETPREILKTAIAAREADRQERIQERSFELQALRCLGKSIAAHYEVTGTDIISVEFDSEDDEQYAEVRAFVENGTSEEVDGVIHLTAAQVEAISELAYEITPSIEDEITLVSLTANEIIAINQEVLSDPDYQEKELKKGTYGVITEDLLRLYTGQIYVGDTRTSLLGYLKDRTNKYTKANESVIASDIEKFGFSKKCYYIIKAGNEGNDAVIEDHIGNQIAYKLLELGYSILYKYLDSGKSAVDQLSDPEYWNPLKDKSIYSFRYITSGGCSDPAVSNAVIQVAEFNNKITIEAAESLLDTYGRGDVVALVDFDETNIDRSSMAKTIFSISKAVNKINSSKYAAIFGPQVYYSLSDTETKAYNYNNKFPASFHYLACAQHTFENYNEWYAVAGKRGVSTLTVTGTTIKLGKIALNTLAPRVQTTYTEGTTVLADVKQCTNLVIYDHGTYVLEGNRTAYPLNKIDLKYSHFLNIRQLCITIKQVLRLASDTYRYDPNSDELFINFKSLITPTLELMKSDNGVEDYRFTKIKHSRKALLMTKLRIVPIEAVEDFDISIFLEESLSGIVMSADEEE